MTKQKKPKRSYSKKAPENCHYSVEPLGKYHSCFTQKTGTPRQSQLIQSARGMIELTFNSNGLDSMVDGLEEYEYLWIVYVFHKNYHIKKQFEQVDQKKEIKDTQMIHLSGLKKTKIKPPRLDGKKVGVLSCRSPYRPNSIGLSLGRLNKIEVEKGRVFLHMSGLDVVDGSPILDIKPYIPEYDSKPQAKVAQWLHKAPIKQKNVERVEFLPQALKDMERLVSFNQYYRTKEELQNIITEMIEYDPRSKHKKEVTQREVMGFYVDRVNCRVVFLKANNSHRAVVIGVEELRITLGMTNEKLKERNERDYQEFVKQMK